jgi:hypothetical protein
LSDAYIFITYFLVTKQKKNKEIKKKQKEKTKKHKKQSKTKKQRNTKTKQKEKTKKHKKQRKKKKTLSFIPHELYTKFVRGKLTGGSQCLCIPGELYPKFARGKLHGPTRHRDRYYPWRIPCLIPTFARGKPPCLYRLAPLPPSILSIAIGTLIPNPPSIATGTLIPNPPSLKPKPEPHPR